MSVYLNLFVVIYIFCAGLCIGSFLNVCIYRLPTDLSLIKPRSACSSCGNVLRTKDLIPVFSYLFLRGKCRYCRQKISIQYPLIELMTGVIFVVLFLSLSLTFFFLASLILMSILIAVFFIDLRHMIIPDALVVAGLITGTILFVLNIFYPQSIYMNAPFWDPLLGMVSVSGFLFLVMIIAYYIFKTDNAFGLGDVKLYLAIGLILGFKLTVFSFFIAVILGGVISAILMFSGRKKRSANIPFGPFIVIGVLISILFGNALINWYVGLLN